MKRIKMTVVDSPLAQRNPSLYRGGFTIAMCEKGYLRKWWDHSRRCTVVGFTTTGGDRYTNQLCLDTDSPKKAAAMIKQHYTEFQFPRKWEWDCIVDAHCDDNWENTGEEEDTDYDSF